MGALEGKVALVTGSARGLGRATAQIFAREGAHVVVVDMNQDGGEESVRLIKDAGGEAIFVKSDVSSSSDVQAMVRAAVNTYGGLDCAVNNAVIDVGPCYLADLAEEDWNRSIAVNLTGVFLGMKYEIKAMLERGGGSIVNIGAGGGVAVAPKIAYYIAAKTAIYGLTKVAALDYGTRGIRVNAVGPGVMLTPLLRETGEKAPHHVEYLKSVAANGRLAEPEEVAEAVVWLCTPAASYVLGETLVVDGGSGIHMGPLVGGWLG